MGRIADDDLFLPKFHLGRGTVRRTVEGQAIASLHNDITNDMIQIAKHVTRRDPQNRHAMLAQKSIPPNIPLRPVPALMSLAIHLDRQARRRAIEVEHIGPSRMLPAKPQAFGPLAQNAPEQDLGQRHVPPQSPCASHRPARLRRYSHRPSTMLRMVPLPKQGLGRNED